MKLRTRRHKLALALSALALAATGTIGAVGTSAAPAEAAGRCVDYNYSQGGYSSCIGYIQQLVNYHSGPGTSSATRRRARAPSPVSPTPRHARRGAASSPASHQHTNARTHEGG